MASILIIEDEPRHAELAARLLRAAGHEVFVETSGESGLRRTRQLRDVGGVYIVSRIRSDPALADLPVVD